MKITKHIYYLNSTLIKVSALPESAKLKQTYTYNGQINRVVYQYTIEDRMRRVEG